MMPRSVILDPAATIHTPEWLFLSTGIRAMDHAVEDICSINPQPLSDGTSIHALRLLVAWAARGEGGPERSGGAARLPARRVDVDHGIAEWREKGASHGIGHVLGGTAGVPHGYTSCVMLPPVLRFNEPVNAERQAWVSEALGRPGVQAADAVADLIASLGLPGTLREVGVKAEQLDQIAEESMHDRWVHTNPRKIAGPHGCACTARCSVVSGAVQSAVSAAEAQSVRRGGTACAGRKRPDYRGILPHPQPGAGTSH